MKKYLLIILIFFPAIILAFTVPARPTGFVQDYANLLTADQVSVLESKLENFERQTTDEIAVVTIPSLDGDTIENVAQDIFTKWGIGKKDKNNGVLLLISLAEHKTRIQTGYGVEGDLTDVGTAFIQDQAIRPAFREGDYYSGIATAVGDMVEILGGNNTIVPQDYSPQDNTQDNGSGLNWQFIILIIFITFQWFVTILARSKSWWGGGIFGGVIGAVLWGAHIIFVSNLFSGIMFVGLILLGLLLDYHVSKAYTKYKDTGIHPPWFLGGGGFGGGRGGFGGGGFGGFGGGGSGGGGSSGGW